MFSGYLQIIAAGSLTALVILTLLHVLLSMEDDPEWGTFWLLMILILPPLGIIFYLIAGVSRRNTFGKRILLSVSSFLSKQNDSAEEAMEHFWQRLQTFFPHKKSTLHPVEQMLDNLFSNPLETTTGESLLQAFQRSFHSCSGNDVQLLCDGTEGYPAMLQAIRSAKKHIHLQSYIFANDPVGRAILAALRERAKAGVEVRILFDRLGSFSSAWQLLRCKSTGKCFQVLPFSHSSLLTPWRIQLRNHRKLLIVDGNIAFTGGLNISYENVRTARRQGIHDFHCRIQGPIVSELQYIFLSDWFYAMGKRRSQKFAELAPYFPLPESHGNNRIRAVASGHGYYFKGTEKVFFTAAAMAQKSLWIITPYFVPPHALSKALRMASARGVDVRIIVPAVSDHWYVKMASAHYYQAHLADSVRIFERQGVFSHAKAMLVDGQWAYLGSSNCDSRSCRLNFELDLLIGEGDFPGVLYQQFLREFEVCREITYQHLHRSLPRKLIQSLCALACPVL